MALIPHTIKQLEIQLSSADAAADIAANISAAMPSTATAKTFLAGPASGAAAAPTFRAIVSGDLPAIAARTDAVNTFLVGPQVFSAGLTSPPSGAGTGNEAFGSGAIGAGASGSFNVAVGQGTMTAVVSGSRNVAIGYQALNVLAAGADNTSIGYLSLWKNTSGSTNVAVGSGALQQNTTGSNNVAAGANALILNTTGSDNLALGFQSLSSNTTASQSIAIGSNTLASNTGAQNVGIGAGALNHNTSGTPNVAIGTNALNANTTGSYNVGIGSSAAFGNTTGLYNVGIGATCLQNNTSGSQNIAIGYQALSGASGAGCNYNVGIGTSALGFATLTGDSNVGIGNEALTSLTSGASNTAVGVEALHVNSTGGRNVGIGALCLHASISVQGQVAIGYQALVASTAGPNTAIGYLSLLNATTGANNVAIGDNTGATLVTGSHNVIIGDSADITDGLTNSIALGASAMVLVSNEFGLSPNVNIQTFYVKDSTSTLVQRADFTASNIDNTHATRKYRIVQNVWDTAAREAIRLDADGSNAILGIGGAATASVQMTHNIPASTYKGILVKEAASQSANPYELQDNSANILFSVSAKGAVSQAIGSTTSLMTGIGLASVQTSSAGVGNGADTTDDTLFSYPLPINAMSANGKCIRVRAWGSTAANANTKDIKLWFGSTALVDSGALNLNAADWSIEFEAARIDSTHISTTGTWNDNGLTTADVKCNKNLAVSDLTSNATTIKVTGASTVTGTANDVLGYGMKIWFEN